MQNREIKFRAWDRAESYMNKADSFPAMMAKEPMPKFIIDRMVFQQYTGLKDKAGKEIYEGDILKESSDGIFEVVWENDWAKFRLEHSRTSRTIQYPEWNRGTKMLVIGNIYENPELLTTQTNAAH